MVKSFPEEKRYTFFHEPKPLALVFLLSMQVITLVVVIFSAFYSNSVLVWTGAVLMGFVWFYNFGQRRLLARALRVVHQLDRASEPLDEHVFASATVIAAARNEEADIDTALRSWVRLNYPDVRIIVVNDHSTDRTREILDQLAAEYPHVTVIHDPELPDGWLGKANAVWQAVQQTRESCRWLLLTDADVILHPDALRHAVAHAEVHGLDFLTCVPRLEHKTWSEQLVLPTLWASLLLGALPSKSKRFRQRPLGVGAFILVKRKVYLSSGGHAVIRGQQPEDALLALAVADAGGKTGTVWSSDMVRVRLYRGYKDMRRILVRKQRLLTDDRFAKLLPGVFMVLLCDILPALASLVFVGQVLLYGRTDTASLALFLLSFWAYIERVRFVRLAGKVNTFRATIPWLHPLGALLRLGFLISAGIGMALKKPMEWRGRALVNVRARQS